MSLPTMSRRAIILLKGSFPCPFHSPSPPNLINLSHTSSSSSPTITRFFSSKANFSLQNPIRPEANPTAAISSPGDDASSGGDDISTKELQKRINTYLEGDMEVLPSIFEAILQRKLSGKHNDTDDELMEELRSRTPHTSGLEEDDDVTSDDEFYTSDEDSGSSSE